MLLNKQYISKSNIAILLVSIAFALSMGFGFYGYGNDYYAAYYKSNLDWGGLYDRLGYRMTTLSVHDIHIGIQVTTFLLSLSTGVLIREFLRSRDNYSFVFFLSLYLVVIHTWPIIMSTSNAMRQGLSMSFIFMALISASHRSYFWLLVFSCISIFTHKSGLLLSVIVLFATFVNNFFMGFSYKRHFLIGMLLLIACYLSISLVFDVDQPSKIIEGDFRFAFVLIGFTYVALSFFYRGIINGPINLSLYYYSFIAPAVLMNGMNWEYERLGMMMLIPYILSFGTLFEKFSNKVYLILAFLALLLLTIYMGMYDALNLTPPIDMQIHNEKLGLFWTGVAWTR